MSKGPVFKQFDKVGDQIVSVEAVLRNLAMVVLCARGEEDGHPLYVMTPSLVSAACDGAWNQTEAAKEALLELERWVERLEDDNKDLREVVGRKHETLIAVRTALEKGEARFIPEGDDLKGDPVVMLALELFGTAARLRNELKQRDALIELIEAESRKYKKNRRGISELRKVLANGGE